MPKTKEASTDEFTELLRSLIIVQLGLAGVPHQNIRAIVGCDMKRVTKILKLITTKKKSNKRSKTDGT